jgi:methyl-coenzyme M reductase subunit D
MTEAIFPQVRIVPDRLLFPETVERLLNGICDMGGIRRIVLNGPRLPATVTEGPGRGLPNPHVARKAIKVADKEMELQVQVGFIVLELWDPEFIPKVREVCDRTFTGFGYNLQEGKFMKSQMTTSDYAKYGIMEDEQLLGMADPKSKGVPLILQGSR